MRHLAPLAVVAAALACASERAAGPDALPVQGELPVLRAAELARVRCLLVAPFENGSDAPHASEVATNALVSEMDPARVRVYPVGELRALFRDTPLELPAGIGPSLAHELSGLLGADAVLHGSIEGQSQDGAPELLVTIRLSLTEGHRLLFAKSILVTPVSGERTDSAVRRAVLAAARPALARLGDPARKRCFDPSRTSALRKLAQGEGATAVARTEPAPTIAPPSTSTSTSAPAPAPAPRGIPAAATAAAPAAAAKTVPATAAAPTPVVPRTPRQADWAKRLDAGERIVLEEVAFAGRSSHLQLDGGLADLAVALFARPAVSVRLEAFVDVTSDRAGDEKLSHAMAQAAARRLAQLGVPRHRVTAAGKGGDSPRLPNFTARGRAANRRVEAVVVP